MTTGPRTSTEIYESLRNSLTGKITKLSNFTNRSFNAIFTGAFATEVRDLEEKALVSELAGFIDFVGGDVTTQQLERLGIDDSINAERVNELMDDQYLDEYVKIVGISRLQGDAASGNVTIETQPEETKIPAGTTVTTAPSSNGQTVDFETVTDVKTLSGETVVTDVSIEAIEVGPAYNVPADTIVRFADPPIGVRSVTNTESTTGGEPVETNPELRERAKQQIRGSSEGGTAEGIKSYLRSNIEGVRQDDVVIEEYTDQQPPYADVIVDGGIDEDVLQAIDFSRPTAIKHNLLRPTVIQYGSTIDIRGTNIDTTTVKSLVETFLLDLGIGNNLFVNKLIETIMASDENIINIDRRNDIIERVTNEQIVYNSGQTDYRLQYTFEDTNGSITIFDQNDVEYVYGSDFTVEDQTGDGYLETVVFTTTPADGDTLFIDYDVTVPNETLSNDEYTSNLVRDEIFTFNKNQADTFEYNASENTYQLNGGPFEQSVVVEDSDGTTYTKNTDWQLAPLIPGTNEDTFAYSTGTVEYTLSNEIELGDVAIIDENNTLYEEGVDYTTIDSDSDGADDTIQWDIDVDGAVADDGGTTTDETTAANNSTADDITLLPSTPATGDAYYFGYSSPFPEFDINISTAGEYTGSITWEYWNGTSWASLSNVVDNTNGFRASGRNSVQYDEPVDWQTTSVATLDLYWVRARVSSFSSITTQPLGQEVEIGKDPSDTVNFTVNYNGHARTIRWGNAATPTDGQNFTVTYDQELYSTEQDVVGTVDGQILDATGDVYDQGVSYELTDCSCDSEISAIIWTDITVTPDDDEEFYFSYLTDGTIPVENREKIDPGTININVV